MTVSKQKELFNKYNKEVPIIIDIDKFAQKMAEHVNFEHGPNVIPGLDDFDTDIIIQKYREGLVTEVGRRAYLQSVINFSFKKINEDLKSDKLDIILNPPRISDLRV